MHHDLHPVVVAPDSFASANHFYPRVLNAQIHPLMRYFLSLGNDRIAERYSHMHPEANPEAVHQALSHVTRHFRWGGTDLFHATNEQGVRRMVVIETNSCPSGQKSMPLAQDEQEAGGYRRLLEQAFLPLLKRRRTVQGELAVLYDKNEMETSGYAATLAELTQEHVHLVPCFADAEEPLVRFENGVLNIKAADRRWHPVRAAFRYVTQRPWTRIPPVTRTHIFNPVLVCLSGGRNKMLADKAYELHNAAIYSTGLRIQTPETIRDVSREEIPLWVARMGNIAVIKVPYSNAGQGVYTVTSPEELDAFMSSPQRYDRYIVQGLIGNSGWSSRTRQGRLYHVGTMPDRKNRIYVADLRFMVGVSPDGFFPVAVYARRARKPLTRQLDGVTTSWEMLGTNLSVKRSNGEWDTESERLLLVDRRDFNQLGIGLDDLIEGYIQTVLAMTAIDHMAQRMLNSKGQFRRRFFTSLNDDPALLKEIML